MRQKFSGSVAILLLQGQYDDRLCRDLHLERVPLEAGSLERAGLDRVGMVEVVIVLDVLAG